MDETVNLILDKLNSMDSDIKELKHGQKNITDKLDSFEKQTMKRFNAVDSKISSVSDVVANLFEFRTDTVSKLKKNKVVCT